MLIVDTDLEELNDDAFALHFLLASGRVPDLVTTIFGNTTPQRSAALGRQNFPVPVSPGAAVPLDWTHDRASALRAAVEALPRGAYVAGLAADGPLFAASRHDMGPASADIAGRLSGDRAATVLALGPLTNVAEACRGTAPGSLARHDLLFCGGSLETGNMTAFSEFNAFADAEAVNVALAGNWRSVTVVPLDVTATVDFGEPEIERLAASGSAFGKAVAAAYTGRSLMWDVVAAVLYLRPDVIRQSRTLRLKALTEPPHFGRLVPAEPPVPEVTVITDVDAGAVREIFVRAFEEATDEH
ncbi:nucleoside hydrolase [Actinoplanes sp. G11-F43]|uniref:nucleoside hydrolase n=1 Tax=Actinoplanes sp. G11-F43 TaxID=3424130 RepID=UPI003D350E23